jgi:rhodanese-related sulfurtransferase
LIPLGKLRDSLGALPRDSEIIPFCKISLRGYEAERILAGEGYKNVKYMDGGIVCWPFDKYVSA